MNVNAVKNENVTDAEREVVARLVKSWKTWQQVAPMGIDYGIVQLRKLVVGVDRHCALPKVAALPKAGQVAEGVAEMNRLLSLPPFHVADLRRTQALRRKSCKGKDAARLSADYHTKTVQMLADDFPAWLEEVELGGFLASVHELTKVCVELTQQAQDGTGTISGKLFRVSFFLREKFQKVPAELLGALEFLGKHKLGTAK